MNIRTATPGDWPALMELLRSCELPSQDLDESLAPRFLVAERAGRILGCIGHEPMPPWALFRSLAISPTHRCQGIASALTRSMENQCKERGIRTAFILTTTAEAFATRRGFHIVQRDRVPPEIARTEQFRNLCPCSALCMAKDL